MKNSIISRFLAASVLAVSSIGAQAGFLGNTVEATAYYPFVPPNSTITGGPVQAVVGGGVEFSNGQFGAFFGPTFNFADTSITITHAASAHSSATFNGYSFFDVFAAIDDIVGVDILSDSTGFFSGNPGRVFFDANHVFVNFESLSFGSNNPQIVLGVRFADGNVVPEPESLALMGLGLLALVASRRKAQK